MPLPWKSEEIPLMLAPMQGVTNWALRKAFIDWVRPDVVWTEFLRVGNRPGKAVLPSDIKDLKAADPSCPLVVQLVGGEPELLTAAARKVQDLGATQVNLNLGCPYGRMSRGFTGGALLQEPQRVLDLVASLREIVTGGFSVKMRAGYAQPGEIFPLLPSLEKIGVDFLVLHPRTVQQEYRGAADHAITRDVVAATRLPVIANGDIASGRQGRELLAQTGAAGLMLGRWALIDPLLFERIRYPEMVEPSAEERLGIVRGLLERVLPDYQALFCGEVQTLHKLKNLFALTMWPELQPYFQPLKKAKTLAQFTRRLADFPIPPPAGPA